MKKVRTSRIRFLSELIANEPWHPPEEYPTEGDADQDTTFLAVGRSLSYWEWFEAHLGLIFSRLIGAPNKLDAANRAYGTVLTFRGRGDMIKAAAESYFLLRPDDDTANEFKELMKCADDLAPRRNEIAHGIVQPYFPLAARPPKGYALVPSLHATGKRPIVRAIAHAHNSGRYAYTATEIAAFGSAFEILAKAAVTFLYEMPNDRRKAGQ